MKVGGHRPPLQCELCVAIELGRHTHCALCKNCKGRCQIKAQRVVLGAGLEPACLSAYAPQTYVSAIPPPERLRAGKLFRKLLPVASLPSLLLLHVLVQSA